MLTTSDIQGNYICDIRQNIFYLMLPFFIDNFISVSVLQQQHLSNDSKIKTCKQDVQLEEQIFTFFDWHFHRKESKKVWNLIITNES
jgi:hypothetical protein